MSDADAGVSRRADAKRNRTRILDAARAAFTEPGPAVSMAEVSRRAGVGMATLYRNFPGRRELLEALYVDEVDAICTAAHPPVTGTPGEAVEEWLRRFIEFIASKHHLAVELLEQTERQNPLFDTSRDRVLAAGRPLLAAAQQAGEIQAGLTLEQLLDMVVALSTIRGDAGYREPLLRAALTGIREPAGTRPGVAPGHPERHDQPPTITTLEEHL